MWPAAHDEQPDDDYASLPLGVDDVTELPEDSYSNLNPDLPTFTPQARPTGVQYTSQSRGMYAPPGGGWYDDDISADYEEGMEAGGAAPLLDVPCVVVPALSLRQPLVSLVLHGVKQIENRNRPTLKQMQGPLALHVSHKEEPYGSAAVSTAVHILRRRYTDEQIQALFQLPPHLGQGHGCIVGIVDVECTWPADLFNEVEQAQLTEQAVHPVHNSYLTQLRNPRWLKYPVRTGGSNRLWQVQIPLDALPDGAALDAHGQLLAVSSRGLPPLYQPGSGGALADADETGLGLLGGDMVRQLHSADGVGEKEKRLKKLQKALRQIEELKAKQAAGGVLEKTQEEKIVREAQLRAVLAELLEEGRDDV